MNPHLLSLHRTFVTVPTHVHFKFVVKDIIGSCDHWAYRWVVYRVLLETIDVLTGTNQVVNQG